MAGKNAFYAQSGGVSAVINASACGLLQAAHEYPDEDSYSFCWPQRHRRCAY